MKRTISICILLLHLCFAAISFTTCDARKSISLYRGQRHSRNSLLRSSKNFKALKHFDNDPMSDSTNTEPYGVGSPFSLAPYDSLAPIPLPENTPPFCVYPPFTPQNPPAPTTIPTPSGGGGGGGGSFPTASPPPPSYFLTPFPFQSPPPSPTESSPTLNPPETVPSPSPPESVPSPPICNPNPTPRTPETGMTPPYFEPSPPSYIPSPPSYVPSPPSYVPSPTIFQPPIVYPPPTVPPPPPTSQGLALWCVAKPSVPDPIIQEAMNYACGSGADCTSIQPDGSCFEPNTLFAHASYAFNSYWQRTKVAGGTCEFGGTAILVTVDPSFDGCHFTYY